MGLVFVPRKKRKQLNKEREQQTEQSHELTETVEQEPLNSIPQWRLAKEQQQLKTSEHTGTEHTNHGRHKKWTEKTKNEMTERDFEIMCHDLQIVSQQSLKLLLDWSDLNVELQTKLNKCKIHTPTPIQRAAIPVILNGDDLIACANTGSGKTLAFVLPIFQNQLRKTLILAPTRELANQISDVCQIYCSHKKEAPTIYTFVGGHDISTQHKDGHDGEHKGSVIVATPGRLLDVISQNLIDISELDLLVFDEADRMVDMGFEEQINEVLKHILRKNQTVMFSATLDSDLGKKFLRPDFVYLEVKQTHQKSKIEQKFELVDTQNQKYPLLLKLLAKSSGPIIVFASTKLEVDELTKKLCNDGISALGLHGDYNQTNREKTIQNISQNRSKVLVATDVASRGLDINNIKLVVNYDFPPHDDIYIHRVGRTGRAGKTGKAVSFITSKDIPVLQTLRKFIKSSGNQVPTIAS